MVWRVEVVAKRRRHGQVTVAKAKAKAKLPARPWRRLGITREQYRLEKRTQRELEKQAKALGISVPELQIELRQQEQFRQEKEFEKALEKKEAIPGRIETASDRDLREAVKAALGRFYSPQFWRDLDAPCRVVCDYFCVATDVPVIPPEETSYIFELRREFWDLRGWHALVMSGGPYGFRSFHRRNKRALAQDILEIWQMGIEVTFSANLLIHFRVSHARLDTLRKKSKAASPKKPRRSIRERYKVRGGHVYDGKKRLSARAEGEFWLWQAQKTYRKKLEKIRAARRGATT